MLRQYIVEHLLNEAPYMSDFDPPDLDHMARRTLRSAIETRKNVLKTGEHHVVTSNTSIVHYHKKLGEPARSISVFKHFNGGVSHVLTSKGSGSVDEIHHNIIQAAKDHGKVWGDTDNTAGAVSLWRKLSAKHPTRVHVMKDETGNGSFKRVGLLKDAKDDEVWGKTKEHFRTRLVFK